MADKIKRFFAKKKEEAKFKLAGPGRKLNANDNSGGQSSKGKSTNKEVYKPPKRNELSSEARAAAQAAMSRIEEKTDTKEFNTSLAAIQAQVRRELEAEKKAKLEENKIVEAAAKPVEVNTTNLAVQGVYFRCPLISDEVLPKIEWRGKIKEFLYDQLEAERGLTACLIIQNCNTKDKVR